MKKIVAYLIMCLSFSCGSESFFTDQVNRFEHKSFILPSRETIRFKLKVYNNPFGFEKDDWVNLRFDGQLVYSGSFIEMEQAPFIYIPDTLRNRLVKSTLIIKKKGENRYFAPDKKCLNDLQLVVSEDTPINMLNLFFREREGKYIIISGWVI